MNGAYRARNASRRGFTIVELLIVIVMIAILAAITIVAYNGITRQSVESSMKLDLRNASTTLEFEKTKNGSYPSNTDSLRTSNDTTFDYWTTKDAYCLAVTNPRLPNQAFSITDSGPLADNGCSSPAMQAISTTNCPANRTRALDARDNHTYWVQKMPDERCWMLTNLSYAGGGDNRYNDVKALANGAGGPTTYSEARYYVPSAANVTLEPVDPSSATDGNGQYGYFYNWCAAMGVQLGTRACSNTDTPAHDATVSICPAGWRLPSAEEYQALTVAIGAQDRGEEGANILFAVWLAQRIGSWNGSFSTPGTFGSYWHSKAVSATYGGRLTFGDAYVLDGGYSKFFGFAVRCIST